MNRLTRTNRFATMALYVATFAAFMIFAPTQARAVDIEPLIVSTDSIDFGTIFPGEQIAVQFRVLLDESHTEPVTYHIQTPAGSGFNLCSIVNKVGEDDETDIVNEATLTPIADTSDRWQVELLVPAKTGEAARDNTFGTINGFGEFTCDFSVALGVAQDDGGTGGDSDGDGGSGGGGGGSSDSDDSDGSGSGSMGTGSTGTGGGSGAYALALLFPPDIIEHGLGDITDTTAEINYITSRIAYDWVIYDTESHDTITSPDRYGYDFITPKSPVKLSHHNFTIGELRPGTTYYYRMVAQDNNLVNVSGEFSFRTKGVAGAGPGAGSGGESDSGAGGVTNGATDSAPGGDGGNSGAGTVTGAPIDDDGTGADIGDTDDNGTSSAGITDKEDEKGRGGFFNFFILIVLLVLLLLGLLFQEEKNGTRRFRWPWLLFWKRNDKNGRKNGKN